MRKKIFLSYLSFKIILCYHTTKLRKSTRMKAYLDYTSCLTETNETPCLPPSNIYSERYDFLQ